MDVVDVVFVVALDGFLVLQKAFVLFAAAVYLNLNKMRVRSSEKRRAQVADS